MKEYKCKVLKEHNRKIIDTKHSEKRFLDRYTEIDKNRMTTVFNDVIEKIIDEYKDKKGEYGFHSKSTGIGGIVMWDKYADKRYDNGKNNFVIKTLFPIKKFHNYKDVDAVIIVEKHIIEWAKEKGYKGIKKKFLCETYKNDDYSFWVSFFEGKLHDLYLDGYIIVD